MIFLVAGHAFPPEQRIIIPSLKSLSEVAVKEWIIDCLDFKTPRFVEITEARRYIRSQTMPSVREELLASLLPFKDGMNHWSYGCLNAKGRFYCKMHTECVLMHNHCSRLLKFLFSSDMEKLKIDLKKVSTRNLEDVFRNLNSIIKHSKYCR